MKAIDEYNVALYEIQAATITEKVVWNRPRAKYFTYKATNHDLEDVILSLGKIELDGNEDFLLSLKKRILS